MKPIIIPVENGKVTFTLAEFRKYMEEAYSQGYSDGCSTGTITNIPYNPYWWRDPYCNLSTTTTSGTTASEATIEGGVIMDVLTCPFCGEKHELRHPLLNIICGCGAKYYGIGGFWLNRATGEKRYLEE